MPKKITSRPGLFRTIERFDESGKKVGESRPNFWGGVDHYDASGRKTGRSQNGIFGETDHYDSGGKKTGHSRPGFWGQTEHFDDHGNKTGESTRGFFGESHYRGTGVDYCMVSSGDEYDVDLDDMIDESYDSDDAADRLDDNGFDPENFDL